VTVNRIRTYRRKRRRQPIAGLDAADGFLERLSNPNDSNPKTSARRKGSKTRSH
jgi:hypothetical protein